MLQRRQYAPRPPCQPALRLAMCAAWRRAAPAAHDRATPRQPALRLAMCAALLFVPRHSVLFRATLRTALSAAAAAAAAGTTVHIVA